MIEETKKKIAENLIPSFEEAGNISLKLRIDGLKTEIKKDNTPVTNGDMEVNKLITSKIENLTPNIEIVSEESSKNKSNENLKTFWLVDPIDGTYDYINDRDEFTINAALIINNKPEIGIIYAPAKKRLFYTYHEKKCFELVVKLGSILPQEEPPARLAMWTNYERKKWFEAHYSPTPKDKEYISDSWFRIGRTGGCKYSLNMG